MGVIANFTKDDIKKRLDAFLDQIEKQQIKRLQLLGEKCVIEARTNKGYTVRTGALTSSTGYMVFVDGVAIHTAFEAENGEGSTNGIQTGQIVAEQIGRETTGVALVVVAGMNYAAYVEAKGYNVLASAEHLAERELPRMLEDLTNNILNV